MKDDLLFCSFALKIAIDRFRFLHIIPPNKNIDEDEYALNDGSRERAIGESPA